MENKQFVDLKHLIDKTVVKHLYPVRDLTSSATGVILKANATRLGRVNIVNTSAAIIYVKFYDQATAPTSASTPIFVLQVAATGTVNYSYIVPKYFSTGLSVRSVTGVADNDNTGAATSPIIELEVTT
jgi:hypothetical protein